MTMAQKQEKVIELSSQINVTSTSLDAEEAHRQRCPFCIAEQLGVPVAVIEDSA